MAKEQRTEQSVVTKLVFVRHGLTEWNLEGRCQGWLNSDLTAEGREGAIGVGKRLRAMHEKSADYRFDVVYSSPLGRAQDTAKLALQQFSEKDSGLLSEMKTDERLKERYYAELQGELRAEFSAQFHSSDMDAKPTPEAESRSDLLKRILGFVDEIIEKHSGRTILIFGHGGFIGTFVTSVIMNGLSPDKYPGTLKIANNSISIVEHSTGPKKWLVRRVGDNDTSIIDWMESPEPSQFLRVDSKLSSGFSGSSGSPTSSTSSTIMTTPRVTSIARLSRYDSNPWSSTMSVVLFTGVAFALGIWVGARLSQRKTS